VFFIQGCLLISAIIYLFRGSVYKIPIIKFLAGIEIVLGHLYSPANSFLYNKFVFASSNGKWPTNIAKI